jgi:hypothetical protein
VDVSAASGAWKESVSENCSKTVEGVAIAVKAAVKKY